MEPTGVEWFNTDHLEDKDKYLGQKFLDFAEVLDMALPDSNDKGDMFIALQDARNFILPMRPIEVINPESHPTVLGISENPDLPEF